jgi:hypothetical protein
MFPYAVPLAIGLAFSLLGVYALAHRSRWRHRVAWSITTVSGLLLWIPPIVFFIVIPTMRPHTFQSFMNGTPGTYGDFIDQIETTTILWIFLIVPLAFLTGLISMLTGLIRKPSATAI